MMQSLSLSNNSTTTSSSSKGNVDLNNSEEKIQRRLAAIKTFKEVSQSEKDLIKNAGSSLSKSNAEISTQLNKIKDFQKRYLKDPPNSTDKMLDFFGTTKGNGKESLAYLKKKVLEVAVKIEPTIAAIVKEQTIKALGCSQEQKYDGFSLNIGEISPLSELPLSDGIYIPVQSVDFFSNLKNSPDSSFGKLYYEKETPSSSSIFKPYGGTKPFPMNKQMYQIMETQNLGKSYGQINGKNYLGKSGQNLFDVQYSNINSFGVTGDYYRIALINREDGSGNITNNVGEFISDYYSTIKLVDTVDIGAQIVNIISGAVSINAQVGYGQLDQQSKFDLLIQRILGLCFDSRREIDVSGVAKVAELDGVDDSFFELTEIDLRNIEVNINNIQNGVMEFVDCDNVKVPVDTDVLISQLIDFRDTLTGQTVEQQVATLETIVDSISQNPDWRASIPNNFNVNVSINTSVIKKIPLAVAASVLSPKVLLPLYTLLSVVQSGATYTYNQAVTSANTATNNINTTIANAGNAGANIGQAGSNIVTNGADFLKTYKTFAIQVISKVNAEFLKVLFEILKKDIVNLVGSIIKDLSKSQQAKKYAIILRLIQIALIVAQLIDDYRKCKNLLDNILLLLSTIGQTLGGGQQIPFPLLALSSALPGISAEQMTINTIQTLQSIGVPTGALPDGSPNLMLQFNLASNKGIVSNITEEGKIEGLTILGAPVTGKLI